jgi:peptidylprolyl isomerase
MKTFLAAILLFAAAVSAAQEPENERARIRRAKIEDIMRLQDLRTPFDTRLVGLLSDEDAAVRTRATLAYASLQDTAVIGLLTRNLTDPDPGTQDAAAFALGQTATRLSDAGRRELEHDLIWTRLPRTQASGRLIEEIGKFGTAEGLADLMTRVANVPPVQEPERLLMSIARFAMRGVVADDGVRFALRYVQQGSAAPWQAVYALQRIGKHPATLQEIEVVRLLSKHADPLARMNLATLLAKLGDAGGATEVLQRLADHDPDWRVRVNALRGLGSFTWSGNESVVRTFRRAFFDANQHVIITALSTFPSIGVSLADSTPAARETMGQLAYIAANATGGFPWQVQAEAAAALAQIDRAVPLALGRDGTGLRPLLRARLLRSAGESDDPRARDLLFGAAREDEPLIIAGAIDGLATLCRRNRSDMTLISTVVAESVRLLSARDVAVAATSASLLGDSLFRRRESVPPLLETLADLRPPHDTEAMQGIILTLGKIGDTRALQPLLAQLQSPDPSVANAAAAALQEMTGVDYSGRIQRKAEPLYVDLDFAYLRSLPPVVRVKLETARGDITIDLGTNDAPFTVMAVLKLAAQRGFYRGLTFHRVVPNFVVQGGDPRGDGWGGPGFAIRSEFSMRSYDTGTVGIASAGKDTEGSQFFITHSPQPHLDGRYTIIGKVVAGMDVADRLQVDDRIYDIVIAP